MTIFCHYKCHLANCFKVSIRNFEMEFSKILLIGAVFIFSHVVGKPQLDLRILEELEIGKKNIIAKSQ